MSAPRKTPYIFTCLHCGKTVKTYPSRTGQLFCSRECSKSHVQQNSAITMICVGCGKEFLSIQSRKHKLYCSQECYFGHYEKSRPIIKGMKNCEICGKGFKTYHKGVKCCSAECRKVLIARKARKAESPLKKRAQKFHNRVPSAPRIPQPKFLDRTCIVCGKEFQATRYAREEWIRKTCSQECQQSLAWKKRGAAPKITKHCQQCGKEFTISAAQTRTVYCSNACRIMNMRKGKPADPANTEIRQCLECGTPIAVMKCLRNRKKYCSRSCLAAHRTKMQSIQSPTSIETKLYHALDILGVKYIPQYGMGRYVPDAWLPEHTTIIEADGTYWHSLPNRQERDRKFAAYAKRMNYQLIRLDEKFINSVDIQGLAEHIKRLL